MRIRYSNTLEDVIAFHHYHSDQSPAVRRARLIQRCAVPLLLLLLVALITVVPFSPVLLFDDLFEAALVVFAVLFAIVWFLMFPGIQRNSLQKQVRRLYAEGANRGLIGPHEMELTDTHLTESNPYGHSSRVLHAIEKVAVADSHAFIYISAVAAHIVPADSIVEGRFQAFLEALERGIEQAWTAARLKKVESAVSSPFIRRER
jgi:hypothetical protein